MSVFESGSLKMKTHRCQKGSGFIQGGSFQLATMKQGSLSSKKQIPRNVPIVARICHTPKRKWVHKAERWAEKGAFIWLPCASLNQKWVHPSLPEFATPQKGSGFIRHRDGQRRELSGGCHVLL